jgi:hypothetical protein
MAQRTAEIAASVQVDAAPLPEPRTAIDYRAIAIRRVEERLGETTTGTVNATHRESIERGRRVAARVSEDEYKALLKRHGEIARKEFVAAGMSRREELELALLRWEIDRVEDARSGLYLDALERIVVAQERMAETVSEAAKSYQSSLERAQQGRR